MIAFLCVLLGANKDRGQSPQKADVSGNRHGWSLNKKKSMKSLMLECYFANENQLRCQIHSGVTPSLTEMEKEANSAGRYQFPRQPAYTNSKLKY